MMENNLVFIKKYISKQRKRKEVLVIFIVQENNNSNLLDKTFTQENVKCHIHYNKVESDEL